MGFGYKLHIGSTTRDLVVPLTADVTTTANVQDNQMYVSLMSSSSSSVFSSPLVCYMMADPGYDGKILCTSIARSIGIICFIPRYSDMKVLLGRGSILYVFMNRH